MVLVDLHLSRRFLFAFLFLASFHFYRAAQVLTAHAYIHISSLPVPSLPFHTHHHRTKNKNSFFFYSRLVFSSICTGVTRSIELHELHQPERFHALAFTIESRGISLPRRSSQEVCFPHTHLIRLLHFLPEIYILLLRQTLAKWYFL